MNKYLRLIGHKLSDVPIFKQIKPTVVKFIKRINSRRLNTIFLKRGLDILNQFNTVLTENNIVYSLVFGSLLGAIRESGFIKHDFDIDIAIWHNSDFKKIESILLKHGFKLVRRFEIDNGLFGREESYEKEGVLIDIFYFYQYDENIAYTNVLVPFDGCKDIQESIEKFGGVMPIQLILPFSQNTIRVPFEGLHLPVMDNALEFLEARYGKNWRIPDPTFVYPKMGDARCNYRSDKKAIVLIWEK